MNNQNHILINKRSVFCGMRWLWKKKLYTVLHFNQTHSKSLSEHFSRHDMKTKIWFPLCSDCVVWWCPNHPEDAGTFISMTHLCPLQYPEMFSLGKTKLAQVNKWKLGEFEKKYFNSPGRKPQQMRNSDRTSSETVTLGKNPILLHLFFLCTWLWWH